MNGVDYRINGCSKLAVNAGLIHKVHMSIVNISPLFEVFKYVRPLLAPFLVLHMWLTRLYTWSQRSMQLTVNKRWALSSDSDSKCRQRDLAPISNNLRQNWSGAHNGFFITLRHSHVTDISSASSVISQVLVSETDFSHVVRYWTAFYCYEIIGRTIINV